MPSDRPRPSNSIPKDILEGLDRQDPETLRTIAAYAEDLAAHTEKSMEEAIAADAVEEQEEPPDGWDEDEWEAALEESDAPAKATLTTKTINDNDYYYFQWREGDAIKSEYVAPVSPSR